MMAKTSCNMFDKMVARNYNVVCRKVIQIFNR